MLNRARSEVAGSQTNVILPSTGVDRTIVSWLSFFGWRTVGVGRSATTRSSQSSVDRQPEVHPSWDKLICSHAEESASLLALLEHSLGW